MFGQLLQALAYIHGAHRLAHRAVRPSCLLLRQPCPPLAPSAPAALRAAALPRLVLSGFGSVARIADDGCCTAPMPESAALELSLFMAPEASPPPRSRSATAAPPPLLHASQLAHAPSLIVASAAALLFSALPGVEPGSFQSTGLLSHAAE